MSFIDLRFLFIFLPVVLIVSFVLKGRIKEVVLLLASLLFYYINSDLTVVLLLISLGLTILIGKAMADEQKRKNKLILLVFGVLLNASALVGYKVYNRFDTNVFIPLGLSFLTFKSISYLVDTYKEKVERSNPIHTALYLSIFTQIQSGPISRYNDFESITEKEDIWKYRINGLYRFFVGLCKKVLIADVLAKIVNEIFNSSVDTLSSSYAWLGSICFSLQLFYDFAGYSDMAIGLTEFVGFKCKENFVYPYMTENISSFWRRWHISLSEWFRDYVYIPLGGSRKGKYRVYFNLLIVWLLTGLWHGLSLNFVIWGLGYFVLISFERLIKITERIKSKPAKILYRFFSLFFINIEWVIFKAKSASYAFSYIARMFYSPDNHIADKRTILLLNDYWLFILLAVIFCFPVIPALEKKLEDKTKIKNIYDIIYGVVLIVGFIWAVSFIVSGQNNPFAYGNF
ncbi:alginate O-acetyltransferase complex protein AlgI [Lachnospiraceae bacterium NE2001]|nr:alginate O-acetyltransferase complex protein AlgI [Lachnospiraceae bacterium NE2001]